MTKWLHILYMLGAILSLSACKDVFNNLYDDEHQEVVLKEGQLYIDASSWTDWHYINLNATKDNVVKVGIPVEPLTSEDAESSEDLDNSEPSANSEDSHPSGIYTYWYDVFDKGLANHKYHSFTPTAPQPDPKNWHIAVHRNNARTNGGEVLETSYWMMEQLPESSEAFKDSTFTADVWNELDVWVVQDQMLQGYIGNQGIKVNPVLSSWLKVEIPPMPPLFTCNSHIFIVHFPDDTYAALQLENYMNNKGIKCCLTINYKYPY